MTGPVTEAELLAGLAGTFSLAELYAAVEAADLTARADGDAVVHGRSDTRSRRRVRGALQHLKRQGRARRAGDSVWVLDGHPEAPRHAVLVSLCGSHRRVELRLQRAADLLGDLDGPADLILTDPPYGLGVGGGPAADTGARTYRRDESKVEGGRRVRRRRSRRLPGVHRRVGGGRRRGPAPGRAPGRGHRPAAVGLGPGRWRGRRPVLPHWDVTVLCRGPVDSARRVFTCPPDLPKARRGGDYPQDFWPVGLVGRADAEPGRIRYRNSLPLRLVDLLLAAFTRPTADGDGLDADHVVDPFLGGGTVALATLLRDLRFTGCDVNPRALAFTAHRLSHALLRPVQPALFD